MPRRALIPLLLLLALFGCARAPQPEAGRVIVLGLDGVDPDVVDMLVAEGKLPHFAELRAGGASGRLRSSKPLLSPILWTTIATGKTPDQHRIGHFVAVNPTSGEQLPVTSQMRRVKALWNILSDAGRRVAVVGWWATWPAESVRGVIVSDHTCYHFLFDEGLHGGGESAGSVFPASMAARLAPLVKRPSDLRGEDLAPFVHVDAVALARPFDFDDPLGHFRWALATAQTYTAIAAELWKTERPDLLMSYVEATDSTAHLFGHLFRARGLVGELAEQQRQYGDAVEAMYVYADRMVGDTLRLLDDRTTLLVLSDHGFTLGQLPDDPSATRDMRRVSERQHREEGILYLYGRAVRAGARLAAPTLVDIAPTVLALSGVAPPRDMPGRVLTDGLDLVDPPRILASYEGAAPGATARAEDASVDPAILERLRSLGYLETESPQGDRNLAAVLFQQGRYAEAATAFQALVARNPDDGALRASLAGALGALGRYDEALAELDRAIALAPLNPEGYHNRGVIHERRGARDAAIAAYRQALRYNPRYAPARDALARLGASDEAPTPVAAAAQIALQLAEQASALARRGDYAAAMRALDDAARAAPQVALIQQYRANVAFLMGDRAGAVAALREGLRLEPDNKLFQENLKRLIVEDGR
ncbi:MAG: alkaline phosphatase family protein [Deltaproteobacteria bacterium]|nr:alkaline phosphatase family protein [Deltaproteobacteria bacterium]